MAPARLCWHKWSRAGAGPGINIVAEVDQGQPIIEDVTIVGNTFVRTSGTTTQLQRFAFAAT
jgi:hypothetical protein